MKNNFQKDDRIQKNEAEENIQNVLFNAIQNSDISVVSQILEKHYNEVIEFTDETQMTILHRATFLSLTLITQTIIQIIKSKIDEEKFKIFLNKKCMHGYTALHYASFRGNIDIIETLIENGANVLEKSVKGLTVLHLAAQGDKPESLIYFKEKYKMDIYELDFNGSTALHWACFMGSENAINFLLTWMDDVNIKEQLGYTPFHLAVFSEKTRILKKLYHKGARVDEKDNKGRTALQLAIENNKKNIVDMLSDTKFLSQWISVPPLTMTTNSYFNVFLFLALNLLGQAICFTFLMPFFDSTILTTFYLILQAFVYVLFALLVFSDPGFVVNTNKATLLSLVLQRYKIDDYCPACVVQLKSHTKHCYYCGKCINEYDHHCIWIHNCIGKQNVNYFIAFLLIVFVNLASHFYISYTVYNLDSDSPIFFPTEYDILYSSHSRQCFSALLMFLSVIFAVPVFVITFFQLKTKMYRKQIHALSRESDDVELLNIQ